MMTQPELSKAYDPKSVEEKWYHFWMDRGYFRADPLSSKPPYCIVIPPPNVTGVLHMGHALVDTLQDVLIRWKRMSGFETLWVPGTDHAGIATQTVVERHLGRRRQNFSREEFLSHVWKWTEESKKQILSQLKRLGCSCDWDRLCFTMDEKRNRAVRKTFKKMFDQGLIYRGDYLVNWDPMTQTALADDEVDYEERSSSLFYLRYPLENGEHLVVATTRPETLLGDTAVAVSPEDERYHKWRDLKVILPLTNRLLPIIADHAVDASFGTGVVKVTPAHDQNDYEIAQRHSLPLVNIMTPDGKINQEGGEFAGLTMPEARLAVVEKLKTLGLVEKIVPYQNRVGVSYRSKADIEPYLSKQWFVRLSSFKESLTSLVQTKRVKLIPQHWENTYFHWIHHLRDWCISRQLWWGHRIPIWYRKENPEQVICYDGEDLPPEVRSDPEGWIQEEDVLDTWFSSALWPFSTLGWPEESAELKKFYPNSTLITGHDILFFWVARMLMMGEYVMGEPPFPETFLHGLIYGKSYWRYQKEGPVAYITGQERLNYDLGAPIPPEVHFKWEKMSKSKGNIIDPLEIIDAYGADAMRMALCASATAAQQIDLDRRRFEEFKNFANKIWNGARFVFMNLGSLSKESLCEGIDPTLLALEDRWILSLLNRYLADVNDSLKSYAFDRAATLAYDFFWKEFCSYYVELTKPFLFGKVGTTAQKETKQKILLIVLCNAVRLLHPLAPFITEELFQHLKTLFPDLTPATSSDPYTQETLNALKATACIVAPYPLPPAPQDIDAEIESTFAFIDQVVRAIRTIRAEMQIAPTVATTLFITTADPSDKGLKTLQENHSILSALIRLDAIHFQTEITSRFFAEAYVGTLKIAVPLPEELREKELLRLRKTEEKLIQQQNTLRTQLSNTTFLEKAPSTLVEQLRTNLAQSEHALSEIMKKLSP
jgi:valyl-tRNA synthetase